MAKQSSRPAIEDELRLISKILSVPVDKLVEDACRNYIASLKREQDFQERLYAYHLKEQSNG